MIAPPLRAALLAQAGDCARMGSPFTAAVLRLLAEDWPDDGPVADRLRDWDGPRSEALPLRLAGALHALVLAGADPALAAAYPPHPPGDLPTRLRAALRDRAEAILPFLDHPPQTNEVARSAALIAAAHWLHARDPLPLHLSELGASAGLNLHFDRYALDARGCSLGPADPALTLSPDWEGPVPEPRPVSVLERRGCDLAPLDPSDPAQRLRLRAYLWPDQPDRRARLDAALALPPAPVDRADAAAWLADRLREPRPGALHLVFHTVAWQYFPPATQAACRDALAQAGARATAEAPLAHLAMEHDGAPDAALTLTLWPGGATRLLGHVDFHGRHLAWAA